MKIGDIITSDDKEWVVVMLTSKYATLERVDNPKISKMIMIK